MHFLRDPDFALEGKEKRISRSTDPLPRFHNSSRYCTSHRTGGSRHCTIILASRLESHLLRGEFFRAPSVFPASLNNGCVADQLAFLDNDLICRDNNYVSARRETIPRRSRNRSKRNRGRRKKKEEKMILREPRGASGRIVVTIINNVDLLPPSKLRVSRGN